MMIHLPHDVENSINAAVLSGLFPSVDDAMTEAARLLLQRLNQASATRLAMSEAAAPAHKPIWEEIDEITASVPDEEFLKLPADGAEQHDHYIYGLPKRSPAQ